MKTLGFVLLFASVALAEGETDVLDRPLAKLTAGHPQLVIYSNRETRETTAAPSNEIALKLHDVPYVTVVHVDLRGVPGFFEGIAISKMRDAFRESVAKTRRTFEEHGVAPALPYEERLAIVADSRGVLHAAHGLAKGFEESVAVVVDPTGREILQAPFPRDREKVEAALAQFRPEEQGER